MYCISAFCFLLTKKKKGHNNIKHLLATLLATLDNLILYYTTKRDRLKENDYLWEINFLNI